MGSGRSERMPRAMTRRAMRRSSSGFYRRRVGVECCGRILRMSESKKLWGGRFSGETDPGFARFNRSFGFDRRLFEADVRGSLAHCEGLRAAGVLEESETAAITNGLHELLERASSEGEAFF